MWIEEQNETGFIVPERVVDLAFEIRCPVLPVDHAWALSTAVNRLLPWLADEPKCGLHLIHGAESGNGWQRPTEQEATLYLSRRTRLELRLTAERLEDGRLLTGKTLDIEGAVLEIGAAKVRKLADTTALYSRAIHCENDDETQFIRHNMAQLQQLGLTLKKVLAGRLVRHRWPTGDNLTRTLFVADLSRTDAITLQEYGVGQLQHLGFGLFIPHKTLS